MRRPFLRSTLALASAAIAGPTRAQAYPSRPVRMVIPFAPGGSTDLVTRMLSQRLGDALGQQVVVEHKPGAGSNVASELVANAPADGYTLLFATSSIAINVSLYEKLRFDPLKDFAPITLIGQSPNALAVHPSVPVRGVAQLIEHVRANPGRLNYGSSGNGATNHLGMELFKSMAKLDIVHVPYKGGAQALTGLVGGETQLGFLQPSTLMPQHEAGRIRIIGIGSLRRTEGLDVPPIAETLPGFESSVWYGLFAPAGTPRPVIDRLSREVDRILKDPQTAKTFQGVGVTPAGGSPEDLGAYLRSEIALWSRVVKASGARVD